MTRGELYTAIEDVWGRTESISAVTDLVATLLLAENESCARISDHHWPESGHIPMSGEGAVSCPMSISIMIRRRISAGADARAAALNSGSLTREP